MGNRHRWSHCARISLGWYRLLMLSRTLLGKSAVLADKTVLGGWNLWLITHTGISTCRHVGWKRLVILLSMQCILASLINGRKNRSWWSSHRLLVCLLMTIRRKTSLRKVCLLTHLAMESRCRLHCSGHMLRVDQLGIRSTTMTRER